MERYFRICTAVMAAIFAVSLGYQKSLACSCPVYDYGFLVPDDADLPANSVGVPWWSMDQTVPTKSDFRVERLDLEQIVSIDFEVRVLKDRCKNNNYPYPYDYFVLVTPKDGFVPGATYRFTCRERHRLPPRARKHLGDRRVVEVTISQQHLEPGFGEAVVEVGNRKYDRLTVLTRSGSCSTEIEAAMVEISLLLPPEIEGWRNALLYTVIIDGETTWRPSKSLCSYVPPGMSWIGKGEELLYSWCRESNLFPAPDINVEPGRHKIEFNAWLPGTDLVISASREIELDCFEDVELYRFDDSAD